MNEHLKLAYALGCQAAMDKFAAPGSKLPGWGDVSKLRRAKRPPPGAFLSPDRGDVERAIRAEFSQQHPALLTPTEAPHGAMLSELMPPIPKPEDLQRHLLAPLSPPLSKLAADPGWVMRKTLAGMESRAALGDTASILKARERAEEEMRRAMKRYLDAKEVINAPTTSWAGSGPSHLQLETQRYHDEGAFYHAKDSLRNRGAMLAQLRQPIPKL